MSFDIHAAHLPRIEVHGTAGSLGVPDPNGFEGPVELFSAGSWQPLPVSAGYRGAGRGTGLADLAAAVAEDRPHLASAELAEHVLDVMLEPGFLEHVTAMGDRLRAAFEQLIPNHDTLFEEIRGKGLMFMVELVADRESKAKFDPALNNGGKLTKATRDRGLIVRASNDGIAISPPLILNESQADEIVGTIAESISAVLG